MGAEPMPQALAAEVASRKVTNWASLSPLFSSWQPGSSVSASVVEKQIAASDTATSTEFLFS